MKTIRYACGCLSQRKNSGGLNWIYCGNHNCPFDEVGDHRKHVPAKVAMKEKKR